MFISLKYKLLQILTKISKILGESPLTFLQMKLTSVFVYLVILNSDEINIFLKKIRGKLFYFYFRIFLLEKKKELISPSF